MHCVVTGVAGFVGSSLADYLLELGHDVLGIDCFIDYYPKETKLLNIAKALDNDKFTFLEKNLLELDLPKVFEGAEYIFHQAAQAGVRSSWGEQFSIYSDNNIIATQKILEASRGLLAQGTLKKVVYASSSSVYGDAQTLPTSENLRPSPVSPYGVSKLSGEHLMVLYAKEFGVPTASLRYFTVYGPRHRPDMAFHRFIKAGLVGEALTLYDDGEQSRDFTFISDILKANFAAASYSGDELVFNIGGGSRVTINDAIKTIEEIIGKPIEITRQDRQKGDVKHTGADISRAAAELAYKPEVCLRDGLASEAKWLEGLLARV